MDIVKKVLKKLGYTEKVTDKIINTHGLERYNSETLIEKVTGIYNCFIELGYSKCDVVKMTTRLPIIYSLSVENILEKIKGVQKLGYTKEEIIKMSKRLPSIYSISIDNMKEKINIMEKLGYSKKEIIKMTKIQPTIYGLSPENIQEKIKGMQEFGYTREKVIKMTKIFPAIYGYNLESMKEKLEKMQELGYTKEDVMKITQILPTVYGYSIANIKAKLEQIQALGYSREEVINMTKNSPTIYSSSIENMQDKIEFYNLINLQSILVKKPKLLMQSTELAYARYMYYKENGLEINETNYRKLFIEQKQFEKQYGLTNKELIEKYDYKKYKEEKSTQALGKETINEQKETAYINETVKLITQQEKEIMNSQKLNKIEMRVQMK